MRVESTSSRRVIPFNALVNQNVKSAGHSITVASQELAKLHDNLIFNIKENPCGGVSISALLNNILIGSFHNGASKEFNVPKFMSEWANRINSHAMK